MKWIDFIMFLLIGALLVIYLIAAFTGITPPVPGYAKMAFAAMCLLVAAGSWITYYEAKNEK